MSLVNKMLRDLDARRATSGERAALPEAVTPLAVRQAPSSAPGPWLGGAVGLLAVAAAAGWWWLGETPAAAPSPVAVAAPLPAATATATAMPAAPATASDAVPPAPTVNESAVQKTAGSAALRLEVDLQRRADPAAGTAVPAAAPAGRVAGAAPAAGPLGTPPAANGAATVPMKATTKVANASSPSAVAVGGSGGIGSGAATPATRPPVVALPREVALAPSGDPRIDKQVRLPTAAERAEADYRRGVAAQRQGRLEEAATRYHAALSEQPTHVAARQGLAALLIEGRHFDDAEDVLQEGIELPASRLVSVLALARLKVERSQAPAALELLLQHAAAGERSADYQGFVAALLNRTARHREAAERYLAATRLAPNDSRWWAGLGMALDAEGKPAEAREAYLRARALPGLPAELAQHVEQRLR